MLDLVMQATQDTTGRLTMVVLHEIELQASSFFKIAAVEAFKEETSAVAEHFRREHQSVRNRRGGDGKWHYSSLIISKGSTNSARIHSLTVERPVSATSLHRSIPGDRRSLQGTQPAGLAASAKSR